MLNWMEKGYGLIEEIERQGYKVKQVDNIMVSSDDVAVQAIIDSYDPLPKAKAEAKARIGEQAQAKVAGVMAEYPEFERLTFVDQEAEARGYQGAAEPPVILSTIAAKRGLTVETLAARVIEKADTYRAFCASVIADRQALEDQIDAAIDWRVVNNINLEV